MKPNVTLADLRERAGTMSDAMTHRGPDDAGDFFAPDHRVALVNRRLAIRDISPFGHMPMETLDAPIALTYNGEIYNADALRNELERAGYAFRSTSDTEVILRGYEAWGHAVIPRLRGIFALAFYDGRGRVLLARDPLGIKPLYYAETDKGLVFASELKALHASELVSRELDPTAIVGYLELGAVPSPRTIYRDIRALEPGCLLSCDLATMETQLTRYWSLPTQECAAPRDAAEQTRAALLDAVKSQLVSDVPLGAFLSGGLDSSAIVALMRQATSGVLRTCSIVFDEAEFSEAPFARAVAEQVGAEHFERRITAQDVLRELPRILRAMDQPTTDGVNSYFVAQTARQAGLTVALSGLGGDELFGGYPSFYAAPRLLNQLRALQKTRAGAALAAQALALAPPSARSTKVLTALSQPASPASAYLAYRGLYTPDEVKGLVRADVWEAGGDFDAVEYVASRASVGSSPRTASYAWTSRAELSTYTLNQLIRDTDVMSMAHSLEVRVPLLDHLLVEQILPLPDSVKQNGTRYGAEPKALLREAIKDLLPPIVRERRGKQGFTFPFEKWLRSDLKNYFVDFAPDAGGLLDPRGVEPVMRAFEHGQAHWARAWSLMVLQGWVAQ